MFSLNLDKNSTSHRLLSLFFSIIYFYASPSKQGAPPPFCGPPPFSLQLLFQTATTRRAFPSSPSRTKLASPSFPTLLFRTQTPANQYPPLGWRGKKGVRRPLSHFPSLFTFKVNECPHLHFLFSPPSPPSLVRRCFSWENWRFCVFLGGRKFWENISTCVCV